MSKPKLDTSAMLDELKAGSVFFRDETDVNHTVPLNEQTPADENHDFMKSRNHENTISGFQEIMKSGNHERRELMNSQPLQREKYSTLLSAELKRGLKRRAIEEERNDYEVLEEALRQYLGEPTEPSSNDFMKSRNHENEKP